MSEDENEDLFLDEDFLQDLDETSQLYYSQVENTEEHKTFNKRRKLNHENVVDKTGISKFTGKKRTDQTQGLSSRKNLILDIFESNSLTASTTTESSVTSRPTTSNFSVKKNPSLQSDSKIVAKNSLPSLIMRKSALETKEKENPEPERILRLSPLKNQRLLSSSSDKIQMERNTSQQLKSTQDIESYPVESFKTPLPFQPKTLVRRFPGPAGLIPEGLKDAFKDTLKDTLKDNLVDDALCYLQNLNDEMNMSNPADTSRMAEFCSQETKKLFSDGAWRKMLDDLPKNFLRGYDIATLKRPGRPNKIPLLAAVIHRIEHNVENPRIVLKDISSSIEAIMHKDIPAKYPDIIQSGVVLLLRDIGVLSFQGAQRYSTISLVMIPPNSILAAYSDKGRIVTTSALNDILKRDYDVEPSQTINNGSKYNAAALQVKDKKYSRAKHDKYKSRCDARVNHRAIQQDLENINPIENFDDISDLDLDEPVPSQPTDIESSTISINGVNGRTVITRAIIEGPPDNSSTHSTITDDDPTEIIQPSEDSTITPSTGFADDLFNDTDDEILSQFDVDSIANNYTDT